MRSETSWISTDELPWEATRNKATMSKLINGSRESEHITVLARSSSQPPNSRRSQVHRSDEEFFVLSGDFTFDGRNWFGARGYCFYPRGCVHGANVHVRGGYEMLLRYDGERSVDWIENPESDFAYLPGNDMNPLSIVEVGTAPAPLLERGSLSVEPLRPPQDSSHGATLIDAHFSAATRLSLSCDGWLECFINRADQHFSEGVEIGPGFYRYREAEGSPILITGTGNISMIVFHGEKLTVTNEAVADQMVG
jgi:Domain of unknown function (DUF4437)